MGTALRIRNMFLTTPLPQPLYRAISGPLLERFGDTAVVVRSSAPDEDSSRASFAGLHDLRLFKSGEVLVCDAVDPSITFFVPLVSAIVERRGGMLIHGAIIAREYGLACVTGIPDAASLSHTGDTVIVDGYLGIVTIGQKEELASPKKIRSNHRIAFALVPLEKQPEPMCPKPFSSKGMPQRCPIEDYGTSDLPSL